MDLNTIKDKISWLVRLPAPLLQRISEVPAHLHIKTVTATGPKIKTITIDDEVFRQNEALNILRLRGIIGKGKELQDTPGLLSEADLRALEASPEDRQKLLDAHKEAMYLKILKSARALLVEKELIQLDSDTSDPLQWPSAEVLYARAKTVSYINTEQEQQVQQAIALHHRERTLVGVFLVSEMTPAPEAQFPVWVVNGATGRPESCVQRRLSCAVPRLYRNLTEMSPHILDTAAQRLPQSWASMLESGKVVMAELYENGLSSKSTPLMRRREMQRRLAEAREGGRVFTLCRGVYFAQMAPETGPCVVYGPMVPLNDMAALYLKDDQAQADLRLLYRQRKADDDIFHISHPPMLRPTAPRVSSSTSTPPVGPPDEAMFQAEVIRILEDYGPSMKEADIVSHLRAKNPMLGSVLVNIADQTDKRTKRWTLKSKFSEKT